MGFEGEESRRYQWTEYGIAKVSMDRWMIPSRAYQKKARLITISRSHMLSFVPSKAQSDTFQCFSIVLRSPTNCYTRLPPPSFQCFYRSIRSNSLDTLEHHPTTWKPSFVSYECLMRAKHPRGRRKRNLRRGRRVKLIGQTIVFPPSMKNRWVLFSRSSNSKSGTVC